MMLCHWCIEVVGNFYGVIEVFCLIILTTPYSTTQASSSMLKRPIFKKHTAFKCRGINIQNLLILLYPQAICIHKVIVKNSYSPFKLQKFTRCSVSVVLLWRLVKRIIQTYRGLPNKHLLLAPGCLNIDADLNSGLVQWVFEPMCLKLKHMPEPHGKEPRSQRIKFVRLSR